MDAKALARLKRLAGKSTLILTHYGRKYMLPVRAEIREAIGKNVGHTVNVVLQERIS